jgi:twitching motility two-component system response regulator PilH
MPNKKILIIEDEAFYSKALGDRLSSEGFDIMKAENGRQGIKVAIANKPDLIILDLLMPGINGMQVLSEIREDVWGKTVPVFIVTNVASETEHINQKVTELTPTYYLQKADTTVQELVTLIHDKLK